MFDHAHTIVRRSPGRLLAGWHDHVVVEAHGRLHREHIINSTRTDLGPVDRPIDGALALALAGTPGSGISTQKRSGSPTRDWR